MSTKSGKSKSKRPLETTLGQAPKDNVDLSHVQKPINTNVFGLKQVLSLFQTATNEVQNYIQYECDILYECRICRSIFRSLANFILHKRNFCKEKFNHLQHINFETSQGFVVENPETDYEESLKSDFQDEPNREKNKSSKKTISPIIDKLLKSHEIQTLAKSVLNEDLSKKVDEKSDDDVVFVSEEKGLILQKIGSTPGAVFQTLIERQKKDSNEFMKSEVMEIHGIFDNNEVVLDSDGKICNFESNRMSKSLVHSKQFACTECETKFSTQKTLTHHIKYKHNKTCIVYPCPDCKETFANAWGVYRHLYKVHRRTQTQVRRMRAQIHSSGIPKSAEPERKKEHRMLINLKDDEENQWMNNFEGDKDFQMCGGCGKRFERKAALHSHSQMCTKRIAVCNNIKGNGTKSSKPDKLKSVAEKNEKPSVLKGAAKRKPMHVPRIIFDSESTEMIDKNMSKLTESETKVAKPAPKRAFADMATIIATLPNDNQIHAENVTEVKKTFTENEIYISNDDEIISDSMERSDEDPLNLSDIFKEGGDLVITKCLSFENANKKSPGTTDEEEIEVFTISDDSNSETNNVCKKEDEKCTITPLLTTVIISSKRKRSSSSNGQEEESQRTATVPPKIIDEFKEFLNDECDHYFFEKALPFMDTSALTCIPCKKTYDSQYQLLWHMSLHFSWYRFQCSKCSFMSFNRFDCTCHAYQQHNIPNRLIESTIMPIPRWKVESLAKNFTELSDEVLNKMEDIIHKRLGTCQSINVLPLFQSVAVENHGLGPCNDLRAPNMTELIVLEDDEGIKEGELGQADLKVSENDNDKTSPTLNVRPVRNRTKSVKTVQDDFIYDLAKALKLNDSSIKNGKIRKTAGKVVKE